MNFISIVYGLFLLSLVVIYWSLQKQRHRLWLLLFASLIFYGSLQIEYIPLLLASVLMNFWLGIAISKNRVYAANGFDSNQSGFSQNLLENWSWRGLLWLWLGIIFNTLMLLGFKYVVFLLGIAGNFMDLPVLNSISIWYGDNVVAPLGISFFSFECIAYLVDVYRGAPPSQQLLKFATYKFFFPKLISGPVTRYHYFASKLRTLHFPAGHQVIEGLWLIACGAIQKGILADHTGNFVNLCFENLQRAGSSDIWLATFGYGLQLYLDFSGYVHIASGSALLLGFQLPPNFDYPYLTTSIADFWRRWHITLGDWLRNYLYFPLGGGRHGLFRTCLNLLLVMLVAGIWHGAAWGFIVWGGLHGLALIVHRITDAVSDRVAALKSWWESVPGTLMAWLLVQVTVFVLWIPFRLPNLRDALWAVRHLWGHPPDPQFAEKVYSQALGMPREDVALLLLVLAVAILVSYWVERSLKLQLSWPMKILLVPSCFFAVLLFAPEDRPPYIYFDF
ncbi:MAG TPA: MBOAT family protein [Oscillatoriaceae cyanobacterium M33_DOE_052]|uniref:MBOAT family protein n=1 Tax=Planktothricoides sp. SpSt-374 TaxID=2282167 RepID=A0A7C3ZUS2_9CYAN|nr:MBOAT family protein [Oscillatoriaceae cyanobacterium M33_DOE_052]